MHGFLIPGGAATLRPGHSFFDAAAAVLDLAADEADAVGGFFPVYGVCLGFEALSIALARNASLLSRYDAEDGAAPLWFTGAARGSRLYGSMEPAVVDDLEAKPYVRWVFVWIFSFILFVSFVRGTWTHAAAGRQSRRKKEGGVSFLMSFFVRGERPANTPSIPPLTTTPTSHPQHRPASPTPGACRWKT